ncbi:hypothetical protein CERSUDRAFT_117605 [Gelatoporia subvermispora B]|uniref:Uncharacterized protein n=1 Tax=Ceriporiopsis subvermispora (strain B) TaxID=914234 RepID=M2QPK2_CERS8|nr:hypothetical protein CERSUDRAFT_117605 [Gelatoporia subvermispora B]
MSDSLNPEEEGLLQSALSTAFTPAPLPRQTAQPPEPAPASVPAPEPAAEPAPSAPAEVAIDADADARWRAEYEQHVAEWRQRSAEQRDKAEQERARWEEIREREREEAKQLGKVESSWENVGASTSASAIASTSASVTAGESPSPVDVRDLVTGEGQGGHTQEFLETVLPGSHAEQPSTEESSPPAHAHGPDSDPDSGSGSNKHEKWEDIPSSLTSSYPSLSFPSDPHSPQSPTQTLHARPHGTHAHAHSHGHKHSHDHEHAAHDHHHAHAPAHGHKGGSATLAIFDGTLSTGARARALLASVAINLLLPFVNGVMLGFGEIFAKNVLVRWLGWRSPGAVVANLGLGTSKERDDRTPRR